MYLSDLTTTSVISLLHLDNGKTKNTFKPTLLQTLNYITDTVHKVSMDEIKVHTETDGLTMQENVNNGIVQIGCRYFGSFEKLKHTKLNISHSTKNTQECDNNTKGQCESIRPAIKHGHVINVCGEHSNGLYIVCFRNYLTSCAFPFDIHANINGLFSYKTENTTLQRKIAAMTIDGKHNKLILSISSPYLYRTSYQCKLIYQVYGDFDYEVMMIHNNKTTVLSKGYDMRDSVIQQDIGYMVTRFRILVRLKLSGRQMKTNALNLTEIMMKNCSQDHKRILEKDTSLQFRECSFEDGVCTWINTTTSDESCTFKVVNGLNVADTRIKALGDNSLNSFVGHFLYVHGKICYGRSASFTTVLMSYEAGDRNNTCKVQFAVIGTLLLKLVLISPILGETMILWNQSLIFKVWTTMSVPIPVKISDLFYLQFETVSSTDLFKDYIAIDDVSFSQGCTFVDSASIDMIEVEENNDVLSLEVIIPVFVVVTKWYRRNSFIRKSQPLHESPVKWTALENSETTLSSISLSTFCNIEEFLTKKNPNYEWYNGRILNNKLIEIPREKLTISNKIGSGAFGEVYSGIMVQDFPTKKCRHVAVKSVLQGSSEKTRADFFLEALTLSKFSHKNIVEFLGVSLEKNSILLVLEYMSGGDLKTYLKRLRLDVNNESDLKAVDMLNMCIDVANACTYLEQIQFVHRDIAARNCLLTSRQTDMLVKIADFGLARDIIGSNYYRKTGSAMLPVRWMSPESFSEGIFSSKSDVWSFGVLMWEIFSYAQTPYGTDNNTTVVTLILKGQRLPQPSACKPAIYDVMCSCWKTDPVERPSFQDLLSHLETLKQIHQSEIHKTPKIYVRQKKYNTYTKDEFEESPLTS
ncbi:anaplastic lymphoma kinase [Mytilus galloprovincialis]|uniref:Anaplastic lymphoma kinase n=1 Tax=Mytilus galloprovincialis TaxID=29158 RepID=A0A8B6FBZ2_MYTGA|nr:anaplastic lymphoma kinase [Mytilus galloprovincialis]